MMSRDKLEAYLDGVLAGRGVLTVVEAAALAGVVEWHARTLLEALVDRGRAERVGKRTYHAVPA